MSEWACLKQNTLSAEDKNYITYSATAECERDTRKMNKRQRENVNIESCNLDTCEIRQTTYIMARPNSHTRSVQSKN